MNYDFTNILEAIDTVASIAIEDDYDPKLNPNRRMDEALRKITFELNKFFNDKRCISTIYTTNVDNDFFGIVVKPTQWNEQMLFNEEMDDQSFNTYMVEFDSKLFDPSTSWTNSNILAGLLYNVSEVIDTKAVYDIKATIDAICCGLEIPCSLINDKRLLGAFRYCVEEYINRTRSIYNLTDFDLVITNEIVKTYGFEEQLYDEFDRTRSLRNDLDKINKCDTLSLNWFYYWAVKSTPYDTLPIFTLRKIIDTTGSILMKNSANAAIDALGTVTTSNTYIEESKKRRSIASSIKLNGMKSIEDDLYEYSMRVKNIDDEASAIQLMRQINNRMGIISDYLEEEDLSDAERKRWDRLYDKYDKLREEMVKKPIYSRKMYGLFVDYNALMNATAANYATLNSMY